MAHLVGFAWSKVASLGFGVSGLESAGVDPSIRNRLIDCFFSISDTSETLNFHGNTTSKYGCGLRKHYFSHQLSKCFTCLSRWNLH